MTSDSSRAAQLHAEPFAARLDLLRTIESDHFWFRGRRELVRRLLRHFVAVPNARILDIGSGTGSFMRDLAGAGYRPMGIDPLATRSPLPVARGNGLMLPFLAAGFDAVTILDVLEHVDDRALLAEASRVLRVGGIALMTVPASRLLWSTRDDAAHHLRRYDKQALVAAVTGSGLTPLFITYYQFVLFPLMDIARTFGKRSAAVRGVEERPGAAANWLLGMLNMWEVRCAPHVRWPWGSSLVAVCVKR